MENNFENHLLISGPTKSGKTHFLSTLFRNELKNVFNIIILICSTYKVNDIWQNFAKNDKNFFIMIPDEDEDVESCLKICQDLFYDNKKDKICIILDDCAFEKNVKKRSGQLTKMAFSGRHNNIFIYFLTQQKNSVSKTFRENVGFCIFFYSPSGMETIFDEFLKDVSKDEKTNICKLLKNEKYSRLCISTCPPFFYFIEV